LVLYIPIHFDDGLAITNLLPLYHWFLSVLKQTLSIVDLGKCSKFLSIVIIRDRICHQLWLSSHLYVAKLLPEWNLWDLSSHGHLSSKNPLHYRRPRLSTMLCCMLLRRPYGFMFFLAFCIFLFYVLFPFFWTIKQLVHFLILLLFQHDQNISIFATILFALSCKTAHFLLYGFPPLICPLISLQNLSVIHFFLNIVLSLVYRFPFLSFSLCSLLVLSISDGGVLTSQNLIYTT
jgi:hypothetical protein